MKRVSLWALLIVCLCGFLLAGRSVCAAPPSVEALGQALGYPSDQLVVTDVTAEERALMPYKFPSGRKAEPPNLTPENVLEFYRITGKDARTFYPILITVAKEGTFFSPKSREIIDLFEAHKDDPQSRGGGMGWYSIPGLGDAGLFFGSIQVRTVKHPEWKSATNAGAFVSEVRVPALKQEIRIALMIALDEEGELIPIPGGETYFATFGPDHEGDGTGGKKLTEIFSSLARGVFDSALANQPDLKVEEKHSTTSMDNALTASDRNDPIRMPATTSTPDPTSEPGQEPGTGSGQQGSRLFAWAPAWFWWGMGFVVAAGALWGIRQSRR